MLVAVTRYCKISPAVGGSVGNVLLVFGVNAVAGAVTGRYRAETGREPNAFAVSAVNGAGFVTTS